jgi:hypothetical protein
MIENFLRDCRNATGYALHRMMSDVAKLAAQCGRLSHGGSQQWDG